VGVLPKPVAEDELIQAVNYAVAKRFSQEADVPARMKLFS
jgi:hypothetical protein